MNAHHKKSSYRPPPPRNPQHFSSSTSQLPSSSEESSSNARQLWRAIERVSFGWQQKLDVVLPEVGSASSSTLMDKLKQELEMKARYQVVRNVNLADLLEPKFLNSFVRKGSLVALSFEGAQDDDVVAIDGRGRLVLSVCKSTYELLGLPGRASMHGSFRQRFIIEISLIDPAFRAGKPGFERVKRLLRNWPRETELFEQLQSASSSKEGRTFDLVMSYTDENGQPRSIELPEQLSSRTRTPQASTSTLPGVSIPSPASFPPAVVELTHPQKRQRTSSGALRRTVKDDEEWWDSFKEWRGLAALGVEEAIKWRSTTTENEEEDGEWGLGKKECEEGSVSTLSLNGLLHPKTLSSIVKTVLEDPSFTSIPFISMILRPFPHSPISHTSKENPPIVGTAVRPNGKKRKRGRGRGEEEEANRERLEDVGGWELVMRPQTEGTVEWWMWEGQ
ncbi:uncharacterized protein JCM6883_003116 [Sporobolomyces salmoneus]|uniref:uncharacterized protein n=1 Tax=Sporobolomyces salmoneus TaxID=183962 RepID=UPI0031794E13